MNDAERIATLKKGALAAPEAGNVALRTRDLRWLIELAERQVAATEPSQPVAPAEAAGDVTDQPW